MWQDAFVTVIAIAAAGVLGRRWFQSRARPAGACPSCASGNACAPAKAEPETGVKPVTFFSSSSRPSAPR